MSARLRNLSAWKSFGVRVKVPESVPDQFGQFSDKFSVRAQQRRNFFLRINSSEIILSHVQSYIQVSWLACLAALHRLLPTDSLTRLDLYCFTYHSSDHFHVQMYINIAIFMELNISLLKVHFYRGIQDKGQTKGTTDEGANPAVRVTKVTHSDGLLMELHWAV